MVYQKLYSNTVHLVVTLLYCAKDIFVAQFLVNDVKGMYNCLYKFQEANSFAKIHINFLLCFQGFVTKNVQQVSWIVKGR